MADIATLLAAYKKDYGVSIGSMGSSLQQISRVPTGITEFDLASGGGFPRGRYAVIYGPESSGKSTLLAKAIAQHQVLWPDKMNVIIDIEDTTDRAWLEALGVDPDRVVVIKPDYAEQAVDIVQGFLDAEDCGIVGMDSLAAMMTQNESESSAEKANVGGAALVVGKLTRRVVHAQQKASKEGRYPTFIAINQTRFKIGQMMGNPEDMPGGNAPKFASSMTVRCYGKNINDTKVSKTVPVLKEVHFGLKKWKCPILSQTGMFKLITYPHKGLAAGQVDDWKTLDHYLRLEGRLQKAEKSGGGWVLDGALYPTLGAIQERLVGDPEWGAGVRKGLIDGLLAKGSLPESPE